MITIRNTGKSPITITAQNIVSGITILNTLPLTIPIGQSADINIRVSPGADGAYNGTIQFRSVECQIDKSITINVIKKSAAYTLSTNKIVFKDLIRCSKTDPILDSIEITASALGIKGDAIIGSISRIGAPNTIYSISLNKDDTLTNGTKPSRYILHQEMMEHLHLHFPLHFSPVLSSKNLQYLAHYLQ